jgi:hypothetical protein
MALAKVHERDSGCKLLDRKAAFEVSDTPLQQRKPLVRW